MNVGNNLKAENKSWETQQKEYEDTQSQFDIDLAATGEEIDAKVKAMGSESSGFKFAGTDNYISYGTDQSSL